MREREQHFSLRYQCFLINAKGPFNHYYPHGTVPPVSNMPPRGSLALFSYGSIGHVAVSLGYGWIEATQGDLGQ